MSKKPNSEPDAVGTSIWLTLPFCATLPWSSTTPLPFTGTLRLPPSPKIDAALSLVSCWVTLPFWVWFPVSTVTP